MTVASEITRLQGAKSDIRQAIIDKGVDVGANLTLDEYAACILEIPTKPQVWEIDYLAVGGGGGGGNKGGGGGAVIFGQCSFEKSMSYLDITIGTGGQGANGTCTMISNGNDVFIQADGGFSGANGGNSGSGCTGGSDATDGRGGGAGAGSNGGNGSYNVGGAGGCGLCGYGGGGGGMGWNSGGTGRDGGGNGGYKNNRYGANATACGGGGGGGSAGNGNGGGGLLEICYKTDGSCGISSGSGGNCCYVCNGYCVHRFTSNGTFTIVS